MVAGHAVSDLLPPSPEAPGKEGSCVCIVATDAPLVPSQLERVARRTFLGLARVGSYASNGSGQVALAFSTANRAAFERDSGEDVRQLQMLRNDALDPAVRRDRRRRARRRCSMPSRRDGSSRGRRGGGRPPAFPLAAVAARVAEVTPGDQH